MKPAARIQSAIEILDLMQDGKRPADQIISDYFKARRYAGSKDRRAVNALVYAVVRNQAKINWILGNSGIETITPRLMMLTQIEFDGDSPETHFNGETHCPAALSEDEFDLLNRLSPDSLEKAPDWVLLEYPEWMETDFADSLGDAVDDVLFALNGEAEVDLRINTLMGDKKTALSALAGEDLEVEETRYGPHALRLTKKVKLAGYKSFKDGLVEIQDEGSQLIALLCQAKGQDLVLDMCAGGGGKTLALAADMKNKGQLYALDIAGARLKKMPPRLNRAGVTNVKTHPIKGASDPWLKQFEKRADRVLIDAPCSGVGTWRRAPESRWKLTPEFLNELCLRQRELLKHSAALVKSGGRLIYATCSLLKRENQDQIDLFLSENPDFKVIPANEIWAQEIGTDCPFEGPYMMMRPDLHETDGFFCAVLERQ